MRCSVTKVEEWVFGSPSAVIYLCMYAIISVLTFGPQGCTQHSSLWIGLSPQKPDLSFADNAYKHVSILSSLDLAKATASWPMHPPLSPEEQSVSCSIWHEPRRSKRAFDDRNVMYIGFCQQLLGPSKQRGVTRCGTTMYMAPEVAASDASAGKDYGTEADMWGLGVILYVMLACFLPFDVSLSLFC
jgi:hypothetical protein